MRPLRIAQVAPPLERVPPRMYGGTERIIHELIRELKLRGHDVTLFASGDSDEPCELIPTVPEALRPTGFGGDPGPYMLDTVMTVLRHADRFDLIHSHLEFFSLLLARATRVPVVSTFHGRLDWDYADRLFQDPPPGLVAISQSQARPYPRAGFAVVHNGLDLEQAPFERRRSDDLCFVGRVAPEKGIVEAIEVARLTGRRLHIAAKIGTPPAEREYYENVFLKALGRADVEFLGEVAPEERDRLMASSYALLMPGAWPEPFGLVAIEALACGTPILARRVGALPEIIRPGIDGFFADDIQHMAFTLDRVDQLDRVAIRESVLRRFSATRMVDGYEAIYASVLDREERPVVATSGGPIAVGPGLRTSSRTSTLTPLAPRRPASIARPPSATTSTPLDIEPDDRWAAPPRRGERPVLEVRDIGDTNDGTVPRGEESVASGDRRTTGQPAPDTTRRTADELDAYAQGDGPADRLGARGA